MNHEIPWGLTKVLDKVFNRWVEHSTTENEIIFKIGIVDDVCFRVLVENHAYADEWHVYLKEIDSFDAIDRVIIQDIDQPTPEQFQKLCEAAIQYISGKLIKYTVEREYENMINMSRLRDRKAM